MSFSMIAWGDAGEIQGRYRGDSGEIQGRYRRDELLDDRLLAHEVANIEHNRAQCYE